MSNLKDDVRTEIDRRNLEHEPVYWMAMTEAEAKELAAGVIPDQIRAMAEWLCEPLAEMAERQRRRRLASETRKIRAQHVQADRQEA